MENNTVSNNNIMTDLCQSVPQNQDLSYPDGFASSPTVDWLAFTVHARPDLTEAEKKRIPNLNPDDRIVRLREEKSVSLSDSILYLKSSLAEYFGGGLPLPSGLNGYQSSLSILGTGRVCWHEDRLEMGVHVILPSAALSRHAQIKGGSIYDLLYDMSTKGAKFTRIDLALDTDTVQMSTVVHAHEADLTVTKAQNSQLIRDYKSGGLTLYIGARQGRRMVRFYDKAAKEGASGIWTRCEVELKHEHAITAVNHLLGGADPRELVLASIDFRLDDNPEINRRSRLDWWQAWVGITTRVTFPIVKAAADIADSIAWVLKQVVPTLAWINIYMGGRQWLWSEMLEAVDKIPEWKLALLPDNRFRYDEEQGAAA